ncbi:MAG TPA: response regulator transcription factor [Pseudogracilibacillus sp.]|nr:response regulator transcription factor [Pseudogracilibacillus sp.]
MKVLVIEDNESVLAMIEMFFIKEGFEGTYIRDGREGFERAQEEAWDCIILDWMLPNMDGITICQKLRQAGIDLPIIMLTAKDSESDQVLGLEIGADDYVTKPFSPLALLARIKAVTRRVSQPAEKARSRSPLIDVNAHFREVYVGGNKVDHLTPKEFDLLLFLVQHEKQVFSREQLLEKVWGFDFYGDDRTVDVHVKRLRHKLGEQASKGIKTVWGVGYQYDPDLI